MIANLIASRTRVRRAVHTTPTRFGLQFPKNGDAPSTAFVALRFLNPHSNGLPIWGPGNAGVTWIWEYRPSQQTGYYSGPWWADGSDFLWSGGSSDTYYGACPYPQNESASGTTHWWEISGMDSGSDNVLTRAGVEKTVVKDVTYLQALRVTHNGGTKTGIFYTELPSVANGDVIERTSPSGFGNSNPPSPAVTWGDAPWFADFQHERLGGVLGRIKIIAKVLSEADTLAEAANMNALVTADGIANIWWGKMGFATVDDLTCDYGTGRAFHWPESTKATLVALP